MARDFQNTGNYVFDALTSVLTNNIDVHTLSVRLTMDTKTTAWFFGGYYKGNPTASSQGGTFLFFDDSTNTINARTFGASTFGESTVSAPAAGTEFHVAGVFNGASSRTVYVDGTAGSEETTTVPSKSVNVIRIGAYEPSSGLVSQFDGVLSDWALWDVVLTADEISALSDGVSPLLIRPTSLVQYFPFMERSGDVGDIIGGVVGLEDTTSGWREHPKIIHPSAQILQFAPAAAAGGTDPNINGVSAYTSINGVSSFTSWNGAT